MKNCRHYYVAVASEDLKLVRCKVLCLAVTLVQESFCSLDAFVLQSTLIDLVCALQGRGPCAFAIVCRWGPDYHAMLIRSMALMLHCVMQCQR